MPVARSALDPRAVGGSRARREHAALLVHPAERRDVVVGAEQDPRLARPRLRGEVGLPLGQPVRAFGEPAGHVGCVPVPHRPPEHREREPVDLEVDDPGNVGCGSRRPDGGRSAGRRAACTCRRRSSRRSPRGRRSRLRRASAASSAQPKLSTDEGVVQQVRRELEHDGVEHQDEHEAEREHERQAQRREQRREHRVQHGDHGGDERARRRTPRRRHRAGSSRRPQSDAAVSAQDSSRRSGLNRGRSGCQETASPYGAADVTAPVIPRPSRRASPPSSRRAAPSARRP